MAQSFAFPSFHDYPPFYTLQPVAATRERQCKLWGALILNYCQTFKHFNLVVNASDDLDLFHNKSIERKVSSEAKKAFFQWLVDRGNGMWKDQSQEIPQWTETIVQWVHDFGLEDSVMTVDEISHGEETAGSELEGLDREIIIYAIRELEKTGKAKLFQGSSQDDIGIKFFK